MINIRLKEREEALLSTLKASATFKIPESSFVFMKIDVDGLTIRPVKRPEDEEDPKPIRVLVSEGKTVVLCVDTGKAQFMNLKEKVQIVELDCDEIVKEKRLPQKSIEVKTQFGGERRANEVVSSL